MTNFLNSTAPRLLAHYSVFPILVVLFAVLFAPVQTAYAHQPFFEDPDTTQTKPLSINDPTISTALCATIDSLTDIDYYIFDGTEGADILVGMTIPQIEGQLNFAPTVAVIGPGLPAGILPAVITTDSERPNGSILLTPTDPESFFEPFSRTSYWRRQQKYVKIPKTSQYTIAVWSESDVRTGKYVLVVGDREIRGGDPDFSSKLKTYWTPMQNQPQLTDLPVWERLVFWIKRMLRS